MSADAPWPSAARRVVYLGTASPQTDESFATTRRALFQLAAARGQPLTLEHHLAPGTWSIARLRAATANAVAAECDALIAPTGDTALGVVAEYTQHSGQPLPPVVFASFLHPVTAGIVRSMQFPGGRMTGVWLTDDWHAKRLSLLRQAFLGVRRVGVLMDRFWGTALDFQPDVAQPAAALGIEVERFDADSEGELDEVMQSPAAARVDGWYVTDSYISWLAEARIIEHLRRLQRPAIHTTVSEVADGGALLAYAADREFVFDALADLTLRVLRGEDPGSIPVQRPRRFILAVRPRPEPASLRIHPSVVRRADLVF
jgi:putative ABC transport system substrate-binding protein